MQLHHSHSTSNTSIAKPAKSSCSTAITSRNTSTTSSSSTTCDETSCLLPHERGPTPTPPVSTTPTPQRQYPPQLRYPPSSTTSSATASLHHILTLHPRQIAILEAARAREEAQRASEPAPEDEEEMNRHVLSRIDCIEIDLWHERIRDYEAAELGLLSAEELGLVRDVEEEEGDVVRVEVEEEDGGRLSRVQTYVNDFADVEARGAMKVKKLALGLAHLIGPHKADDRAPSSTPNETPPPSPYPGRRAPLSSKVEADLRLACAGVLVNTKPSHQYVPPDEPKQALDYDAIKRSASTRKSQDSRPFPPRVDSAEDKHPLKYAYRPDAAIDQLFSKTDPAIDPVQSILGRSKYDTPMGSRAKTPVPNNVLSPASDAATRPRVVKRSLSGETDGSTPITDATDYHWSTSTAPTSAAITPARTSKRTSSHAPVEQELAIKDAASAIEWMRNELERRRQKQDAEEAEQQQQQAALPPLSRAPSRSRSIRSIKSLRDNIKEYIRPSSSGGPNGENSRAPSRSASRSSLRSDSRSQDPDIRGGWRSWGRTLKKEHAQTDVSRSNSRRGRGESPKLPNAKKSEINLNRELPPLPSLDQWKDEPLAAPTRPAPQAPLSTHPPPRSEHSKNTKSVDSAMSERDEIIAARLGSPVKQKPEVYMPTRSPRHAAATKMPNLASAHTSDKLTSGALPRSKSARRNRTPEPAASTVRAISSHQNGDLASTRLRSPSNPAFYSVSTGFSEHRNYDSSNIPTPLGSISSTSTKTRAKERPATSSSKHDHKRRQVKDVVVRSPPPVPPKEASDKKAWWNLKSKNKKPATWMDQLEKLGGVKDGILIADEACSAPHIRY
ncbi:hypothetical protein KCU91_g6385, partial [Aureobasidium melanogenum]